VQRQKGVLDDLLEKYARDWDVNRFAAVDKSILRLALFELLHPIDTPASIIINEAIELAKKFGAPDSSSFVNGILDNIYTKELKQTEPSHDTGN
ncbi:MAG: transcription antitermination factor NusB, partial [Clostridiales bacterium]